MCYEQYTAVAENDVRKSSNVTTRHARAERSRKRFICRCAKVSRSSRRTNVRLREVRETRSVTRRMKANAKSPWLTTPRVKMEGKRQADVRACTKKVLSFLHTVTVLARRTKYSREREKAKEREREKDIGEWRSWRTFLEQDAATIVAGERNRRKKRASAKQASVVWTKLRPSGKWNAVELEKFKCARLWGTLTEIAATPRLPPPWRKRQIFASALLQIRSHYDREVPGNCEIKKLKFVEFSKSEFLIS